MIAGGTLLARAGLAWFIGGMGFEVPTPVY